MYLLAVFSIKTLFLLVYLEPINNKNPSPRTGPQDLLVPQYDSENQQKTKHKYANSQITQCESEPQDIESTTVIATLYSKARPETLTGCELGFFLNYSFLKL